MRRIAFALCALLLLGATAVSAQDISGTVIRIDQPARVVVFDDGRMWRMTSTSVLLVDNQPAEYTMLQPGSRVVLRSWEPVTFREGQYIVVAQPSAVSPPPVVVTPAPAMPLTSGTGTVSRVDFPAGVIVFTDGRMVQTTPKSVILVNDRPLPFYALRPGLTIDVKDFNPVVYRDGRSAVLNTGYRDPGNGSSLTSDSKYTGYEADEAHAGMQIQSE